MPDEEATKICPSCGGVLQFNTHARLGQAPKHVRRGDESPAGLQEVSR